MATRLFTALALGLAAWAGASSFARAAEPVAADDPYAAPAPPPGPRLTVKFGKGAQLETADGDFAIRLGARAQVRSTVVVPEEDDADPSADFMIRRLRLTIDGHAFGEAIEYKIQLAFTPLDQDPAALSAVRDANLTWNAHRDVAVRAGQMKVPFGRQRVVSSGSQAFVDRSIVTGELNLDRDVGLYALSDDLAGLGETLGYQLGVFGGDGRNRVSGGYGLLYAARFEVRPLGGTPELSEPDFERKPQPRLSFGFAGAFNHQSDRVRSTIGDVYATGPWVDYAHAALDWRFKYRGLAITGEALARRALVDENTADVDGEEVTDTARSGVGGFVQVGQMIGPHFEVSARYGVVAPLSDVDGGLDEQRELGGALSWYFQQHALKLQADYFHFFEPGGDGADQVRLQLQIAP